MAKKWAPAQKKLMEKAKAVSTTHEEREHALDDLEASGWDGCVTISGNLVEFHDEDPDPAYRPGGSRYEKHPTPPRVSSNLPPNRPQVALSTRAAPAAVQARFTEAEVAELLRSERRHWEAEHRQEQEGFTRLPDGRLLPRGYVVTESGEFISAEAYRC